jgi:CheY-like chemotaxis protein
MAQARLNSGETMRDTRPILLVEDDTIDAMTVRRAFRDLKVSNPLTHVTNGEEALAYLRDPNTETPCVVLLDLNMPKMSGTEFLQVVKADAALQRIPVVVLTTSNEERDVIESFKMCVGGYIVKPVDYRKFVEAIKMIDVYWTLSELPVKEPSTSASPCQPSAPTRS